MDTIASQGSKNMTVFFIFCTTSPNRFTSLSWGAYEMSTDLINN